MKTQQFLELGGKISTKREKKRDKNESTFSIVVKEGEEYFLSSGSCVMVVLGFSEGKEAIEKKMKR